MAHRVKSHNDLLTSRSRGLLFGTSKGGMHLTCKLWRSAVLGLAGSLADTNCKSDFWCSSSTTSHPLKFLPDIEVEVGAVDTCCDDAGSEDDTEKWPVEQKIDFSL